MLRPCDDCGRPTANLDGLCGPCDELADLVDDDREPDFEAIVESHAMARSWVGDRV